MKHETIIINGIRYPVNIHFGDRAKPIARIGSRGISISIPLGLPREEQFRLTLEAKKWAIKKLEEKPVQVIGKGMKIYKDGDVLKVGNDEFLIRIAYSDKKSSYANLIKNEISLNISNRLDEENKNKHISVLLSRIIASKKSHYVKYKMRELNNKYFNFEIGKIFLKYNLSNWGSCSGNKNLNISTRSLFLPDDVFDYICIHELAHLKEQNHSKEFWKVVENAMPNYLEKEKWLKENADKVCWF